MALIFYIWFLLCFSLLTSNALKCFKYEKSLDLVLQNMSSSTCFRSRRPPDNLKAVITFHHFSLLPLRSGDIAGTLELTL